MALDMKKLQQKQAETAGGGGKYFKPKPGKNMIRVYKFSHEVTKSDVAHGYFEKDQIGEEVEELDRPITLHYNYKGSKKPVMSNKDTMAAYNELVKSSDPDEVKKAETIKPGTKYFVNVVDTNDVKAGIRPYGMSKGVYNDVLKILNDPEYGGEDSLLGRKGRDFIIEYNPKASGSEMYSCVPRAEGNSEKLSSDMDEDVLDLYDPEVLATIAVVLTEEDTVEGEDEDEDEDEPKPKSKVKDDEDEDDDEDDEDALLKKKKSNAKKVDDWLDEDKKSSKKKNK